MKRKFAVLSLILVFALGLYACGNKNSKKEDIKEKSEVETNIKDNESTNKEIKFVTKQSKTQIDNTTEVLIDGGDFSKNDIAKVVKHGDHWHVFTKDGREIITYTDPEKAKNLSDIKDVVNTVSKNDLKKISGNDVVKILKHGDHWHIYTADGNEYITHENPSSIYPNIAIGEYTGSHGNPVSGTVSTNFIQNESGVITSRNNSSNRELSFVPVLSLEKLKNEDIVKILKHGDHYHVYRRDGKEFITYENPSKIFSNLNIGEYVGNHGDKSGNETSKVTVNPKSPEKLNTTDKNRVSNSNKIVRILVHEDHWHLYTEDGTEYVTHKDPSKDYPHIKIEKYVGRHDDNGKEKYTKPVDSAKNINPSDKKISDKKEDTKKDEVDKADNQLGFVPVVSLDKLKNEDIVKILKHGNHYHVYRKDGKEFITYSDPSSIFPNIEVGKYEGNHRDATAEETKPSDSTKNPENQGIKWPKNVKRIVDHGDHWHLYVGDNEEEIVVTTNPKEHYPGVEYIVEKGENDNVVVNDNEMFTFNDVPAVLKPEVIPYLDENLKAMRGYGDLNDGIPVFGSNGVYNDIFYWLHGNHYHAITIKQIIQNQKAGNYGKNSARDVVSTLKYIIANPNEKIEVKLNVTANEVHRYLMNYYKFEDKWDVEILGNKITVYIPGNYLYLNLTDFDKVNGKIISKVQLPPYNGSEKNNEDEKIIKDDTKEKDNEVSENIDSSKDFDDKGKPSIPDNKGKEPADKKDDLNDKSDETKNDNPDESKEEIKDEISESEDDEDNENEDNEIEKDSEELLQMIIKKYAPIYKMTEQEFEDYFWDLPFIAPIDKIKFNNDITVEYNGQKYNFSTGEIIK